MPRGGSKPGEHRGGRAPGTPNKVTLERLLKAERDVARTKDEGGQLAKEVLEDFMVLFAGMAAFYQPLALGQPAPAGRRPDESKFEKYARLAVGTASNLAPYQSPTFKAIAVMTPQLPAGADGKVVTVENAIEMDTTDPIQIARLPLHHVGGAAVPPWEAEAWPRRPDYDWKNPDHGAVMRDRLVRLKRLREHPHLIPLMKAH